MTWAKGRKKGDQKRSKRMDIEGETLLAAHCHLSHCINQRDTQTLDAAQPRDNMYMYIYRRALLYSRSFFFFILISLLFLSSSFGSCGNNNEPMLSCWGCFLLYFVGVYRGYTRLDDSQISTDVSSLALSL